MVTSQIKLNSARIMSSIFDKIRIFKYSGILSRKRDASKSKVQLLVDEVQEC